MRTLCLLLISVWLALSCDGSGDGTGSGDWQSAGAYNFPSPPGAVWIYDVYDSNIGGQPARHYELTVRVEQVNTWRNDSTVAVWSVQLRDINYLSTIRIYPDSVTIWPRITELYPIYWKGFPLPLRPRVVWKDLEPCSGSLIIGPDDEIMVPAGSFRRTLAIVESWGGTCVDFGGQSTTWFAPGVGAVKASHAMITIAGQSIQEVALTYFAYPK